MYINMDEWAAGIMADKKQHCLPLLYYPFCRAAGYSVIETLKDTDGSRMADVMKLIAERYPHILGVMTGMDLSMDSEAFGCNVSFEENKVPTVSSCFNISTVEEADMLTVPDPHAGRLDIHYDAVRIASSCIDKPVFGDMMGPFSLAANIINFGDAMVMTARQPEVLHAILNKTTQHLINRAMEYKLSGANGVIIAEPTAGLLSPKMGKSLSSVYVRMITEAVQDESFHVILHNCGNTKRSLTHMYEAGCKGYHFGNMVDIAQICKEMPDDVLILGNLDPYYLAVKSPEEIVSLGKTILEAAGEFPNFVFSTGCDVPVNARIENLDTMLS